MSQQIYDDEIDIREYARILAKRWKIIVLVTVVAVGFAWIYSSMQKPIFEARTTILMRNGSNSALSQYPGLAGALGINLPSGGGTIADLLELIKSRAVAMKVLDDLDLTKRIKGWDAPMIRKSDLASAVSGMVNQTKYTGNVVEIMTQANEAQLTADVANAYVDALAYYWNELNVTEAKKKLKYIEAELPRVEQELNNVENKLKLTPRSSTGFYLAGQGGIQRDYEIYNSVYTMLRKELESTKLETSKETPPFSVLDPAEKPLSKSKPKIKLNMMIGLVLGLFVGVFGAFFQEYWEKSTKRA